MEMQNGSIDRAEAIEKLNELPQVLFDRAASFIDYLATYGSEAATAQTDTTDRSHTVTTKVELEPYIVDDFLEPISTWKHFFEDSQKLPFVEGPPFRSLSKQERRDLIAQGLVKKYESMGLDLSTQGSEP